MGTPVKSPMPPDVWRDGPTDAQTYPRVVEVLSGARVGARMRAFGLAYRMLNPGVFSVGHSTSPGLTSAGTAGERGCNRRVSRCPRCPRPSPTCATPGWPPVDHHGGAHRATAQASRRR